MNHQPSDRTPARPLRVAMVVPPWLSVPPPGYGGLEQVVAGLVDALIDRGNAVTVFGTGREHGTSADFVSTGAELQYPRLGESLPELAHLARVNHLVGPAEFDVIHDHTTIGPLVAGRRAVPTVATVHGNPVGEYGTVLSDTDHGVGLVAISHAQRQANPGLPWVGTVHNAMPLRGFPRKRAPGADRCSGSPGSARTRGPTWRSAPAVRLVCRSPWLASATSRPNAATSSRWSSRCSTRT